MFLLSVNSNAQDKFNYNFSVKLFDKEKIEMEYGALSFGTVTRSAITRKSYAITECSENIKKKTRVLTGKEFLKGYAFSVNPHNGFLTFTEYQIDDANYNDYDVSTCFNGEVAQIEFTTNQTVEVGNKDIQYFSLSNGKILSVVIYK
jgi:hypothetical protein